MYFKYFFVFTVPICVLSSCEFDTTDAVPMLSSESYSYITNDEDPMRYAKATYQIATSYKKINNHLKYFEYVTRSKLILEVAGLESNPFYAQLLVELGNSYYRYGDFNNAKIQFLSWHKHENKPDAHQAGPINTLGMIYQNQEQYDSSNYYLDLGIEKAKELSDSVWIGIMSGNKAVNYHHLGLTKQVHELFMFDYEQSLLHNEYHSALNALVFLGLHYASTNNFAFFEEYHPEIHRLMTLCGASSTPNYLTLRSKYYEYVGAFESSLNDYKNAAFMRDSFKQLYKIHEVRSIDFDIYREFTINQKTAIEKIQKLEKRTTDLYFLLLITFIVSAGIFTYFRFKKYKSDKLKAKYRQQIIEQELQNTQVVLQESLTKISLQSEQMEWLYDRMEQEVSKNKALENSRNKSNLNIDLSDVRLLTDANWNEFKSMFSAAYPNFIDSLIGITGKLSYGEQRLACMIRLNLTTNQMADMTGVSLDAAKKSLLRLKNKLKFDKQADLVDFIYSLPT